MMNEQRALATLDLTLKNAFETLNKFSTWATTPHSYVTFNLVDALPLEDGALGTGAIATSLKVPSFANIRSSIFGTSAGDADRDMYWNIAFKAMRGWSFNGMNSGTKLDVLVNTSFGSTSKKITLNKTNVTGTSVNSTETLSGASSIIFNDGTANVIELSPTTANLNTKNVKIGSSSSTVSLKGSSVLISDGTVARKTWIGNIISGAGNIFQFTTVNGSRSIEIGPKAGTYSSIDRLSTVLRSGSVSISARPEHDLIIGYDAASNEANRSLLSSYYVPDLTAYDIYLATLSGMAINSLSIGEDNYNISNLFSRAKNSFIFGGSDTNNFGLAILESGEVKLTSGTTTTITSPKKTYVGSQVEVAIGIDDGTGSVSNEILVNKGSVLIPNLYISKKSNYILSGMKHVNDVPSNSLAFIPSQITRSKFDAINHSSTVGGEQYTNALEYTTNIHDAISYDINGIDSIKVTTFKPVGSASLKSYILYVTSGESDAPVLGCYSANCTTDGLVSTSYVKDDNLEGITLNSAYADPKYIHAFGTDNYLYIAVLETNSNFESTLNLYYSEDAKTFTRLVVVPITSDIETDDFDLLSILKTVSFDNFTDDVIDSIWFSLTFLKPYAWFSTNYYANVVGVYNIVNNCGLPTVRRYNEDLTQSHHSFGVAGNADSKLLWDMNTSESVIHAESLTSAKLTYLTGCYVNPYIYYSALTATIEVDANGELVEASVMPHQYTSQKTIVDRKLLDTAQYQSTSVVLYSVSNSAYELVNTYTKVTPTPIKTFSQNISFTDPSSNVFIARVAFDRQVGVVKYSTISCGSEQYVKVTGMYQFGLSGLTIQPKAYRYLASNLRYFITNVSVGYFALGSTTEVILPISSNLPSATPNPYKLNGAFVDYFNIGGVTYSSNEERFSLSNSIFGENSYKLGAPVACPVDTIQYLSNGELISYIDLNSVVFGVRQSPFTITGNPSIEAIVARNRTLNILEGSLSAPTSDSASGGESKLYSALNMHIEPISYLTKNSATDMSGISLGGYHFAIFASNATVKIYKATQLFGNFSGYRIPFNQSGKDACVANATRFWKPFNTKISVQGDSIDLSDRTAYDETFIIVAPKYSYALTVHEGGSTGMQLDATGNLKIPTGFSLVRIDNCLVDSSATSFNPEVSIINEFSNVVSVKVDYLNAYRSGMVKDSRSSILLGLTEVVTVGGGC